MQTRPYQNLTLKTPFLAVALFSLFSTPLVQAQILDRPKAGPDQKKLEVLHAGVWKYEWTSKDTPQGPGGKFAGMSTNRMVLDGLFLESRGEDRGIYGGKEMTWKGVTLQQFDSATKAYAFQNFNNDGLMSRGSSTLNGNTWTSTGSGIDSKGKPYRFRDTTIFSGDGKQLEKIMRGHNTWKKENGNWLLISTYNTPVKKSGD